MPPPDDQELTGRAAELLERLVSDADLRARFRRDPASVCAEYGLLDVAEELRRGENVLETLEIRESRSSLAGALMAAVGEGVGAVDQLDEQSVGAGGSGDVGVMADSAQVG